VLGLDYWLDENEMNQWYESATYDDLGPAFTGAPVTSTWKSASADWVEW
jgi:hypothetical protein